MGGEPYWYTVKYQDDIDAALQELRQREFEAGRYNPVTPFLWEIFPITPNSPAPGAQHASIEDALEASAEDGTRSILDLFTISEAPEYCAAARVSEDLLNDIFGTTQPTRQQVEDGFGALAETMERGQGVYIVLYKDGAPDEILFAGCSFD